MRSDPEPILREIARVSRGLTAAFDTKLRDSGLTAARGRVLLFLIKAGEPLGQAQLTSLLQVENPTAVRIIDGLEALGYVKRLPDPTDRRAKLVCLTAEGKPIARTTLHITSELGPAVLEGFSDDEINTMTGFLTRMSNNIDRTFSEVITPTLQVPA